MLCTMNMTQTWSPRVIHACHDKGLPDCKIQTAPQGAAGMVVCMRSELGKDMRSKEVSLGELSSLLAQEMSTYI